MSMPLELVMVRHGQSEANTAQRMDRAGSRHPNADAIYDRVDWKQRLSEQGVRQAEIAGEWIDRNIPGGVNGFDIKLVSPYLRTRETAAHLGGPEATGWRIDDRIVERYWGSFGRLNLQQQEEIFPHTAKLREDDPWYACLDGGESPASGVRLRFRDLLGTLHREAADKRVIMVSHGEFMWVGRQVLERTLPEEWIRMDSDKSLEIRNCSVLQYSRVNPDDPTDIDTHMRWMRFIYPDAPEQSPYGGKWIQIKPQREFTGSDLLDQLEIAPNLITDRGKALIA